MASQSGVAVLESPAVTRPDDRVEAQGRGTTSAKAELWRGGAGITWQGISLQMVGSTASHNFLLINGHRPVIRRNEIDPHSELMQQLGCRIVIVTDPSTSRHVTVLLTKKLRS